MTYRRKIIDRRTREGKALGQRLDAIKGFGVLALVVGYFLFGRDHRDDTGKAGSDNLVTQAQAAPSSSSVATPARQQPGFAGYPNRDNPGVPAAGTTTLAANSIPSPFSAHSPDAAPERQQITWRHVTPAGVRWSLRNVSSASMLLVIELGGDRVANVSVAPAFERLDMTGMNDRVDHVRSEIARGFPLQSGNFSFDRDGTLRQAP